MRNDQEYGWVVDRLVAIRDDLVKQNALLLAEAIDDAIIIVVNGIFIEQNNIDRNNDRLVTHHGTARLKYLLKN